MSAPTPAADPVLVARLRADLESVAYTVEAVGELLGPLASAALDREQMIPAQRVTAAAAGPLATLVRLFGLGDAVDIDEAAAALPSLGLDGAAALRLVRQQGPGVVATCDLRPYGEEGRTWWVASDLPELATRAPLSEDHVLGIGGASTTLASWTPRPVVERALDVGTGCGVQALHLGSHARHVTVTDISTRALEFARFNAALNGVEWEVVEGSMLDPVAGQRFGLIVSNPPFVITPRTPDVPLFEYRDGGQAGDTLVADLVRSIGDHLEAGGVAQFLGNWEVVGDTDWRERVRGWVAGTGLDAWIVQRDVQDPAEYAETWSRDGGHHSATTEFATMYAAWLDDFASRGVSAIGFGVITLQRPVGDREPFVDLTEATGPVAAPMGSHVLSGLRARTWLAEHDDDELLAVAWRCADDVVEERHGRPGDDEPAVIQLRQGGGLGRVVRLDTVGAALVSVCDGSLPAGVALSAIAELLGEEADAVRSSALPLLRGLVADGLLV
ncbi:Methyltransferase small domain-containing protein [Pedococcus dokdonensis]|uniref:Methyltransferase small domain-containing protein n=1 Tax=Pedococcus dokdonensis TaxID=443156 RepID=A0A1H0UNZ5_9MICO|nr:class I SAM-dependent methyltransferase [Pedococcus dokdonensis]SDP67881.1 Methyltransferase small domain-containing protein [Pedococcus dokdonensis]